MIKSDSTGASGCWETPFDPPVVDQTHPIVDRELHDVTIVSGESFEPEADGPASANETLCGCGNDECPADLDGNGVVGFSDLLILLSLTGACPPCCPADLDDDGFVGFADLLALLSNWGECP